MDRFDYASEDYIHVNSCGINRTAGREYMVLRRQGRRDYHILLVEKGLCEAEYAGKILLLEPGDLVIYYPGQPQCYRFRAGEETITDWVHFSGTEVSGILQDLGLAEGFCRGAGDSCLSETGRLFRQLSAERNGNTPGSRTRQVIILLELLRQLSRRATLPSGHSRDILAAQQYIEENYSRQLTVSACAARVNMSESRFAHRFREQTGQSPYSYITDRRMHSALSLLNDSDLPVKELAVLCGFTDALYFSRLFRQRYGVSPSGWRQSKAVKEQ